MSVNSEKGFRLLMGKYKEPVYWHIRRLVVAHDDAQDATQETFIRVFRSLSDFKGDGSLRSWIYSIATREAIRVLDRKRRDNVPLDEESKQVSSIAADEYVDYSDLEAVKLQKAILSLPTKQQVAFNLRYYNEMEYDEIARITESTTAGAKQNYHLAKDKIIKYIRTSE